MARRANQGIPPIFIALVVLIVGLAAGGVFILSNRSNDPFNGVAKLEIREYLENGNGLRGNVYQLTGKVQNQLSYSPSGGRLLSIQVEGDYGSDMVPVLVPAKFSSLNFQKGQTFVFKLGVGERGVLTAEEVLKT